MVLYHIWNPEGFTHAIHLFRTCAADCKVCSNHRTANEIKICNKRLQGHWINSSNYRLHKVRTEADKNNTVPQNVVLIVCLQLWYHYLKPSVSKYISFKSMFKHVQKLCCWINNLKFRQKVGNDTVDPAHYHPMYSVCKQTMALCYTNFSSYHSKATVWQKQFDDVFNCLDAYPTCECDRQMYRQ